jgi:hypothetical protein
MNEAVLTMQESEELALRRIEVADMIREAREAGNRPRVHPNGFVQLDLRISERQHRASDVRLHIWPEEGRIEKQATDNTIHDHVFDMNSNVLRGVLGQALYKVHVDHKGKPSHEIYMANYSCRHSSELAGTGVQVKVVPPYEPYWIFPGDSYNQPAWTFHDTVAEERPLVTVMEKQAVYQGNPRVLVPMNMGQPVDNDFDRLSTPEELLWEVIDEAYPW